jgi:hypothetical protein
VNHVVAEGWSHRVLSRPSRAWTDAAECDRSAWLRKPVGITVRPDPTLRAGSSKSFCPRLWASRMLSELIPTPRKDLPSWSRTQRRPLRSHPPKTQADGVIVWSRSRQFDGRESPGDSGKALSRLVRLGTSALRRDRGRRPENDEGSGWRGLGLKIRVEFHGEAASRSFDRVW